MSVSASPAHPVRIPGTAAATSGTSYGPGLAFRQVELLARDRVAARTTGLEWPSNQSGVGSFGQSCSARSNSVTVSSSRDCCRSTENQNRCSVWGSHWSLPVLCRTARTRPTRRSEIWEQTTVGDHEKAARSFTGPTRSEDRAPEPKARSSTASTATKWNGYGIRSAATSWDSLTRVSDRRRFRRGRRRPRTRNTSADCASRRARCGAIGRHSTCRDGLCRCAVLDEHGNRPQRVARRFSLQCGQFHRGVAQPGCARHAGNGQHREQQEQHQTADSRDVEHESTGVRGTPVAWQPRASATRARRRRVLTRSRDRGIGHRPSRRGRSTRRRSSTGTARPCGSGYHPARTCSLTNREPYGAPPSCSRRPEFLLCESATSTRSSSGPIGGTTSLRRRDWLRSPRPRHAAGSQLRSSA